MKFNMLFSGSQKARPLKSGVICKKMKDYISVFIVFFVLLSFSCSNNSEKKKLEEMRFKYLAENLMEDESKEIIVLLSIKYGLTVDLTQKILNGLIEEDSLHKLLSLSDTKTVKEFEQLKSKLEKPPIEARIKKFSIENNISQSKIASLLIDYKIWYESQHDESY